MAAETGLLADPEARILEAHRQIGETGSWHQSAAELEFGARLAWRNSVRCIGRVFWRSLRMFDARSLEKPKDIFDAIVSHIIWSTNDGDLRPAITIFRSGNPMIRILNQQLILYAGYRQHDGSIVGDPKNVMITEMARRLGWGGQGGAFDILPLIIQIGTEPPILFEFPKGLVLEVEIRHPNFDCLESLGLRWFALPAVSAMALDLGGVQYSAAPTSGVYQGTEIGSFNLADPFRYNKLPEVAKALGIETGRHNPLWRDQALVELNRSVLHSFQEDNVRIFDHHTLMESFATFRDRENQGGRTLCGDWSWLIPPMSSNLSWVWHETGLDNTIFKPGYFYQPFPENVFLD
jgi:nitric-oxide synthase